jgi:ABC-type multidrug transport system fused ATPase/permease subunit
VQQLISRFYDPNEGRVTFDGDGESISTCFRVVLFPLEVPCRGPS